MGNISGYQGGDLGDLIELDMYDVVQVWVSEAR